MDSWSADCEQLYLPMSSSAGLDAKIPPDSLCVCVCSVCVYPCICSLARLVCMLDACIRVILPPGRSEEKGSGQTQSQQSRDITERGRRLWDGTSLRANKRVREGCTLDCVCLCKGVLVSFLSWCHMPAAADRAEQKHRWRDLD